MNSRFIDYHEKPIFRNNYKLVLGCHFKNPVGSHFSYCDNNKKWFAFLHGDEIGILNTNGVEYALSFCNPEDDLVKELRKV